ncbi:membrane protein insertase YidC [Neobacillus sp. LXY-4]|uniref:membrane protein insertase YidC n=1 Tax=Neobacillus sp. LXY-4 TaxID=3379826 RepID=UPI003EDECCBE
MKFNKSTLVLFTIGVLTLLLTGCSQATTQNNDSLFHQFLVEPFTIAIQGLANLFQGSFGLAIIFITIIIRLVLMPLMLRQYKSQQAMKEKMDALKPELTEIQEKIKKTKDQQEQAKLQQEMFGLYKKHGVNPLGMGCLPVLIQMPILMGLYYAISSSKEIASHSFLWFNLGHSDIWITLVAGLIYYFQFKVSQSNMTVEQQQQMKLMGLISPIMIVFMSLNAPAALPLYWTVGGLFLVIQTLLARKMYKTSPSTSLTLEK